MDGLDRLTQVYAIDALSAALASAHPEVRDGAVEIVMERLIDSESDALERQFLLYFLSDTGHQDLLLDMAALVFEHQSDEQTRIAAIQVLSESGSEHRLRFHDFLTDLLEQHDLTAAVRRAVLSEIAENGAPAAQDYLTSLLSRTSDPETRELLLELLAR